jgi:hypothetical protein
MSLFGRRNVGVTVSTNRALFMVIYSAAFVPILNAGNIHACGGTLSSTCPADIPERVLHEACG